MPSKTDPFDLLDDPEIIAEPVAPEAAIEFWKQRAKLTWEEAKGLADGAKARAFYVTGLYQQDLVNMVSDALQAALENGETLPDFKKRIADVISKQGWKDYRVETIFRTNMQSAYAAGRYRKMRAVKESRPYWQYLAIMDKRTRPSHAILHGKVYPADHEFWQSNYPPNGFRCRCGVATLSERQVKAQNLTVETKMPEADMWKDPKTGMEYFVNFPGADKGFRNNPYEEWAKNGGIDDLPGLKDFKPVKKAPVTQKSLQTEIGQLDEQIKAAASKEEKQALEAQKAKQEALLQKKAATAAKNKLKSDAKKLQAKVDAFSVKTYSGIWQQDVTTADWAQKAASIQPKKEYFLAKLANGGLTADETAKFQSLLKDLDDFSEKGQQYYNLKKSLQEKEDALATLKSGGKTKSGKAAQDSEGVYSEKRKNAALWAKSTAEADKYVRTKCGEVWRTSTKTEKNAIYGYTEKSGAFNRPLGGYQKPWNEYSSVDGWEPKFYKGVKNVWLNYEDAGARIRRMTDMISRSSYDFDMMLQRGCNHNAIESYLGLEFGSLKNMTNEQLQKFVGKKYISYSFTSTAVAEGKGFSHKPVIMKIYAPRGTQMMYAEPFSHYGNGAKKDWDGVSEQSTFGSEAEMIIQRGASFRITLIEKRGEKLYMEVEVRPEEGYDLFQQNDKEWKGSREKYK